ncbi:ABC transporter ATP-binding protein [Aquabacterium sp. A08]|uniref:ABC transporter ATP-binding protein n=1 Tax=Aquabacterium sp. A08 TaxID=2718532 RepID=UPI00141DB9DD|nr:ABC transporter ATP-binding protein [Aquabacterium sp. A08]NIC40900.1 ATP-binding cassette domain-containing protein [Aquabacterium sp. A08]NIC43631.1 ATP-binding cassette domain-containing protein [Aquabacterium sp. A08]
MTNLPDPAFDHRPTVLQAQGLAKAYGGKPALRGVDLCLHAGELVALLGPNGAGKSTLMQLLTGLFVPDAGQIQVLGHDLRRDAPRALAGLGVVFQQMALDLDLSVRANLLFHTDLHGLPRAVAQERIAQGLAALGLPEQAGQPVRALSGGNRRKVELVRAMLHRPRVLLMDEATVGLDPASRQQLRQAVQALRRDTGVAVLWTTHLVDEVADADRVVVLHQGQVRFDGPVPALLARTGTSDLEAAFLSHTEPQADLGPSAQP